MQDARYHRFLAEWPSYAGTLSLDAARTSDYEKLDGCGQVYLDYTGGGVFAGSQARKHFELLGDCVYGNPHSSNPSSIAATRLVESARRYVLDYFKASPEEYLVIFTANASGALKLVGESYPFGGGRYLLTFDNHNSVNGIREFARHGGARVSYVPVELPDLRVPEDRLFAELDADPDLQNKLFAYPAQSNFSSVQHPLEWVARAQERGWDVLLDAAAFAPTNRLDLSEVKPDFVPLSFYKIFGYPTGIGALIAKRSSLAKLRRPWFAGGTITVASVQGDKYYLSEGAAAFEDGTVDYLGIPAVEIGIRQIETLDIDVVHSRVVCLTGWLLGELGAMRHGNGQPIARIYGPTGIERRGGAVTVNFHDAKGRAIDHRLIEAEANRHGISIRTGCFCNPGAGEVALGISRDELATCFLGPGHEKRLTIDDFRSCITSKSTGAVRISVGLMSNWRDVETFLGFAGEFVDRA